MVNVEPCAVDALDGQVAAHQPAEVAADRQARARSRRTGSGWTPRPGRTPRTAARAAPRSSRCRCPRRRRSDPVARALAATVRLMVPWSVNLAAFESRLNSACRTFVWSACMVPRSSGQATTRVLPFFSTSGWTIASTSRTSRPTSNVSRNRSIRPASILERSRMSLISPSRCLPAALIRWRSGRKASASSVLGLLLEHLGVADDRVQRRPQFVAHVRQELRLVLRCLFERPVEPGVVDRQRRLRREGLEQRHDVRREQPGGLPRHHQAADDTILAQDRHGQHRAHAAPGAARGGRGSARRRPRDPRSGTARGWRRPGRRRPRRGGSGRPGGWRSRRRACGRLREPRRRPRPRRTRRRRRRPRRPGGWRSRRWSSAPAEGRATRRAPGRLRRAPAARRPESCSSSNRRAFSIAITAWSANVSSERNLRSVNGRTSERCMLEDADRYFPCRAAARMTIVP